MMLVLSAGMNAEDITLKITKRYLNLPVSHQQERAVMTLAVDGKRVRSNRITGCFAMYPLLKGNS